MKILAKPGLYSKLNTASSPQCLYKSLLKLEYKDVEVIEWSPLRMMLARYDIIHLHWPDNVLRNDSYIRILARIVMLMSALTWVRIRGKKIIWTSHNIESHHSTNGKLEKMYWKMFLRRTDGILIPSESIKKKLEKKHPITKEKKSVVTYFGNWLDLIPNEIEPDEARRRLGISENEFVILWFGSVRPYKGVERLIASFQKLNNENTRLIIAGMALDDEYKKFLESSIDDDKRISTAFNYVPNDEIQVYYKAANLAALPFKKITNSGSARLALHFDCPVLVPDFPIFKEMKKVFGSEFVYTYDRDKDIFTEKINEVIQHVRKGGAKTVDWKDWNWESSAGKYYQFCQRLIN